MKKSFLYPVDSYKAANGRFNIVVAGFGNEIESACRSIELCWMNGAGICVVNVTEQYNPVIKEACPK